MFDDNYPNKPINVTFMTKWDDLLSKDLIKILQPRAIQLKEFSILPPDAFSQISLSIKPIEAQAPKPTPIEQPIFPILPSYKGSETMAQFYTPEYVGYPTTLGSSSVTLRLEGTGEGGVIYVRYKRYSDGAIFWIPVQLEGGAVYTQAIKTVKLSHGEIWSPIGLPNEILTSVVERYLAEHGSTVQEEQPSAQIPTQSPVGGNGEKKDNTWLWILGIVAVIVVIFLLKKR